MGIEGANLKNESLFQTFVALRNERLQMVMCDVECYGMLKCCATGLEAFLSSFSMSQRCPHEWSRCCLPVLPLYSFL